MIKILLADDHALLREGLRKSFEAAGDTVVGEASTGEEAVALARALQPNVVLMDLSMPVMDGIEATRQIREEGNGIRVAVLTMHDDIDKTRDAIAAGASAYLSKGTSVHRGARDGPPGGGRRHGTVTGSGRCDAELGPAGRGRPGSAVGPTGGDPPGHRRWHEHQAGPDVISASRSRRCTNHLNAIYRKPRCPVADPCGAQRGSSRHHRPQQRRPRRATELMMRH